MEEFKYQVYVQVDSNNFISRIESSISSNYIDFTIGWILIDEGQGDKYAHAQGNYFPRDKGLIDMTGKYNYKLVDGKVVELSDEEKVDLDLIKQIKINELNQKCNETIINGFYSAADGTKKLYDFELENQVNLSTKAHQLQIAKLAGQPIPTVSYYGKGETCHDYTADQFWELAQDGESWKTSNIVKYKDKLKPMVEACTTADEVNAITWYSITV